MHIFFDYALFIWTKKINPTHFHVLLLCQQIFISKFCCYVNNFFVNKKQAKYFHNIVYMAVLCKIFSPSLLKNPPGLQNNTNKSSASLVNYFLQCLLKFQLCVFRHPVKLVLKPSLTSSCNDFPKMFDCHNFSGSFSNSFKR